MDWYLVRILFEIERHKSCITLDFIYFLAALKKNVYFYFILTLGCPLAAGEIQLHANPVQRPGDLPWEGSAGCPGSDEKEFHDHKSQG